jgi:hypothetical protein
MENNEQTNETTDNKKPIGIVSWGYVPPNSGGGYDREDLPRIQFMKFAAGQNIIRVLTPLPAVFYETRLKIPGSNSKWGDRIRTSFPAYENCPIKQYWGVEGKERFALLILSRATKDIRIWDFSANLKAAFLGILENENSQRDPQQEALKIEDMDFAIKFDPKSKTPGGFYTPLARHPKPLSAEDQKIIADIGGLDVLNKILVQHTRCPKPETVLKNLEKKGWKVGMPTAVEKEAPEEGEITDGEPSGEVDADMNF